MKNKLYPGYFITLEGADGTGKTTLIEGLYAALAHKKNEILKTRAPGGTPLGQRLRELVLSHAEQSHLCELFLFLADRAEHVDKLILPALKKGALVLCDRFNDSTVAYQGAARGLDPKMVKELCTLATQGLQPDLTIYLDLDPSIGLKRIRGKQESDHIEQQDRAFHEKLRTAFHAIAKQEPDRFRMIDASQSKETVLKQAMQIIDAEEII